jgi:Uma2 family endonuclease
VDPGQYPEGMSTPLLSEVRDDEPTEDHFVRLTATWDDYERLDALRGEKAVPRLTYLEGTLELMSPSRQHEHLKSAIAHLVATYCLVRAVRFTDYGSWTLKQRQEERGAEPDACFIFGDADAERPHLAIEVVWTSGGLNKLEVYRKLGVQEVWYWRKGRIRPYGLRGDSYVELPVSEALPGIDLALLCSFLDRSTYDAMRDYRAALESA